MTQRPRICRDDDGVALVLALVFILVVGLFSVVALSKSQATLLGGERLRERGQLQYSLDGGIDRSIQVLRSEMADPDPATCAQPAAPSASGTLTLNATTTTWTCTLLAGRAKKSSDLTNTDYAIVVTGSAPGGLTSSGGASGATVNIGGSVYLNSQPLSSGPLSIGTNINVSGDLVGTAAAGCSTFGSFAAITVTSGYLKTCTEQTLSQAIPAIDLPSAPAAIPAGLTNGIDFGAGPSACRVFYPGTYTAAPGIAISGANYFVSGVYVFNGIGTWTLNNNGLTIDGGQRNVPTDSPADTTSGCRNMNDSTAMGLAGVLPFIASITPARYNYGVTWVLGGDSAIDASKGDVNLYSPPVYGSSTQPLTFAQFSSTLGTLPSGYAAGTAPAPLSMTSNNLQMFVNGKIYAPSGAVGLFATNDTYAVARGGVIAKSVDLKLSNSIGAGAVEISSTGGTSTPPPPFRTIKVVSSVAGNAAANTSVFTISNFSPYTVYTKSWRTS